MVILGAFIYFYLIYLECFLGVFILSKDSNNQREKHILICYLEPFEIEHIFNELILEGVKGWYIYHEPESVEKKYHSHVYLEFLSKVSVQRVAKLFGVSSGLVKPCKNLGGYMNYCTHKGLQKKTYLLSDFCFFNFSYDLAINLLTDDKYNEQLFYSLFLWLTENNISDYRTAIEYCCENGLFKLIKPYHFIIKELCYANEKRNKYISIRKFGDLDEIQESN